MKFGSAKILLLLSLLFLSGCYKKHLFVQIESIDENFLASTHVNTPDWRQAHPPYGQRIIISWDFPLATYGKKLSFHITVRFWDNSEEVRTYALTRRLGTKVFYFENKNKTKDRKILTYRIQVLTEKNEIVETWKHQFWTNLIDVDKD